MPFASSKQERWMFANHPQMAKRWKADEKAQDSRGIPPKKRTDHTDFRPLSPGPKARHRISKPASEQQAMAEGHGINFQPGSHPGPLNKGARLPGVKKPGGRNG